MSVRYWVIDNWCEPVLYGALPDAEWPGWEARYDNDCERNKFTTRNLSAMPAFAAILSRLQESIPTLSNVLGYPAEADPTLHGGGLHVMRSGGWLNTHLDYDRHPHRPSRRHAMHCVAFVHREWRAGWGGDLYFTDPNGRVTDRVEPRPGRLVCWEAGDLAYHGVAPVTGPVPRVTLAACGLEVAGPANVRTRAVFLPLRVPPRP